MSTMNKMMSGIALALALSAVGNAPAEAHQLSNGFWLNSDWANGFWLNGFWLNDEWQNGFWLNGESFSGGGGGYVPGSSSFAGGTVDGIPLAGMTKEGNPVHAWLRGSEIVGEAPDASSKPREGEWFVGATIQVSAVPFKAGAVKPFCSWESLQGVERNDKITAAPVTVRIKSHDVRKDGVHVYGLLIEGDAQHAPSPFCGSADRRAIALQGSWGQFHDPVTGGAWQDGGPDRFTFACEGGALAKCVDAGYHPWEKPFARQAFGMSETADPRALHQACTRMVRADICGDGRGFTVTGTGIEVIDRYEITELSTGAAILWSPSEVSDSATQVWWGEAYWDTEGALAFNQSRLPLALSTLGYCRSLERVTQRSPILVDDAWHVGDDASGRYTALFVNGANARCRPDDGFGEYMGFIGKAEPTIGLSPEPYELPKAPEAVSLPASLEAMPKK